MEHEAIETRRRRALFRATHRGTKEMDWMLGKYAEAHLSGMDGAMLDEFEQLLSIADPDLNNWIITPDLIENRAFGPLISAIRTFHGLDETLSDSTDGAAT